MRIVPGVLLDLQMLTAKDEEQTNRVETPALPVRSSAARQGSARM